MSIGQNIKALRRKADITQEELAQMLYISPQAVSRWETDMATPDVSLIPLLCDIFNVTSDEILGIDILKNNEKINAIIEKAKKVTNNAEFERALEMLKEASRRYPSSYSIKVKLANAIINVNSRKHLNDYDEVFKLCNDVLLKCTDNILRYEALDLLGTAYNYAGKSEEMLKIAEQMPSFGYCREKFLLWEMDGDKGLMQKKEYLSLLVNEISTVLYLIALHEKETSQFAFANSKEDRITILKHIVDITDILFPERDYQFQAQNAEMACSFLVNTYLKEDDKENAIYWLSKMCEYVIHFDTYDFEAEHTSPSLRGYKDGGWIMENGCNDSFRLLENLTNDPLFDKIRNDSRVCEIMEKLKKTAKNNG